MKSISAAIISLNEEKNIDRCLRSLKGVVDEIVVVDSLSVDKTEEICAEHGVRFIRQEFLGHIEQKNLALSQCSSDFVLSLDADEELDEELQRQILGVKSRLGNPGEPRGYYVNRLTRYGTHWVRHCGWYPDWKLRLVDRRYAQWGGMNPHDILLLEPGSRVERLRGTLRHYSYPTISDHVQQTNHFTTIAARAAFARGVRSSTFKIVTRPFFKFIRDYFLKLGFLDGRHGFIICSINALSALLKYSKLREIERGS